LRRATRGESGASVIVRTPLPKRSGVLAPSGALHAAPCPARRGAAKGAGNAAAARRGNAGTVPGPDHRPLVRKEAAGALASSPFSRGYHEVRIAWGSFPGVGGSRQVCAWVITCHPKLQVGGPFARARKESVREEMNPRIPLSRSPASRELCGRCSPCRREKGLAAGRTLLRALALCGVAVRTKSTTKKIGHCSLARPSTPPASARCLAALHPLAITAAAAHASHQSAGGGRSDESRQDRLVQFRGTWCGEARRGPPALARPSSPPKCGSPEMRPAQQCQAPPRLQRTRHYTIWAPGRYKTFLGRRAASALYSRLYA